MKQYTQQEVEKRYEQLPQAMREALYSSATTQKMLSIGRKNGLLVDKIGILAAETGYVMVGLTHPNEFVSRLAEALALAPIKAREIAEDINEQVFKTVREHLLVLHNIPSTDTAPKKPESFAPAMQQKKEEKPSFVAPMIFPEKMPSSAPSIPTISPTPTPTNSNIPTIKKMPLEPSGSWKPSQPITPVFDQMRKQQQQPQLKAEPTAQKTDPYHELINNDASLEPITFSIPPKQTPPTQKLAEAPATPPQPLPETISTEQVRRIIPPAPQFITPSANNLDLKKSPEVISTPTQPTPAPQPPSPQPPSQQPPAPQSPTLKEKPLGMPTSEKIQPPQTPTISPKPTLTQTPSYTGIDPYHEPTE